MRANRMVVVVLITLLAGCAAQRPDAVEHDPLEGMNRKIFWFNDKLDTYMLEPVASGWDWVAPDVVQRSVANFFENLRFPIVFANDLLQGKVMDGGTDVARFAVNTTVGVAGFFDPASRWGLDAHEEDFGQTLGVWGVPAGPYLVLPILGPSNPRDAFGLAADTALSVTPFFVDTLILTGARVGEVINVRSRILEEVRDAKEASFDYYTFIRNAYIQRRKALVADSEDMEPEQEEDLYDLHLVP